MTDNKKHLILGYLSLLEIDLAWAELGKHLMQSCLVASNTRKVYLTFTECIILFAFSVLTFDARNPSKHIHC